MVVNGGKSSCRQTGQSIWNNVCLAFYVLYIRGKLCNETEMSGLLGRPFSSVGEGEGQWLVVCVDCQGSTLHKIAELLDGKEYGQKLTVKGTVLSLCCEKFAAEEGD